MTFDTTCNFEQIIMIQDSKAFRIATSCTQNQNYYNAIRSIHKCWSPEVAFALVVPKDIHCEFFVIFFSLGKQESNYWGTMYAHLQNEFTFMSFLVVLSKLAVAFTKAFIFKSITNLVSPWFLWKYTSNYFICCCKSNIFKCPIKRVIMSISGVSLKILCIYHG